MKNKECQQAFKEATSNSNTLSSVFDSDEDINIQTNKFLKLLYRCIYKCFRKVKINKSKESEYEKLYGKWVKIKNKNDLINQRKAKD